MLCLYKISASRFAHSANVMKRGENVTEQRPKGQAKKGLRRAALGLANTAIFGFAIAS